MNNLTDVLNRVDWIMLEKQLNTLISVNASDEIDDLAGIEELLSAMIYAARLDKQFHK